MVILRALIMTFCLGYMSLLLGGEVQVTANLTSEGVRENQPVRVSVTVMHDKADLVDTTSFTVNGKPVAATYIKDVAFSGTDTISLSFYQLTLDGMSKGLQVIPSISVKVGDQVARSVPITIEVGELSSSPTVATGKFKLEAFIEGKQPIYPGQRVRLVYRYIYNDSIELTKEVLPLKDAAGLQKVGALKVKDYEEKGYSVREVTQEVEAIKPGKYDFPPSYVEGYVYRIDTFGSRSYLKPMITSEIPSPSLIVKDFPAEGKPASFNGAIGPFDQFTVTPKSNQKVVLGDNLGIVVKIGGKGRLDNVPLPELCCQPGFSGRFQLSDLPPTSTVDDDVKTFNVDMRPLSDTIKEFPEVEFSYFDPDKQTYGVLRSASFLLIVTKAAVQPNEEAPVQLPKNTIPQSFSATPPPVQIEAIKPITESDLENHSFGSPWVYWILPIGAFIAAFVFYLKKEKKDEAEVIKIEQSPLYLQEAIAAGTESPRFIPLASKALLTRLKESGHIQNHEFHTENLPKEGVVGEVRALLMELEEYRFSGQTTTLDSNVVKRIEELYKKL